MQPQLLPNLIDREATENVADQTARIEPAPISQSQPWPLSLRIAFRFAFCYLVLYNAPDPPGRINILNSIPGGFYLSNWYAKPWHSLVPWVATHVFGITGRAATYFPTGSGDTAKDYVLEFCFLVLSLLTTVIWSILDRKRQNYRTLYTWLRVLVRYTLAFTLFGYGFAKVFPLQFSTPNFARLLERYGDFSPMGALWWFMGASLPYIVFAGSCEVLPGILLLFRRTATFGAMIGFVVMSNVMLLNYCYDVPVKLYSTNLVLMSLFLILPDLRRLARVFVLNQPVESADLYPIRFKSPRLDNRWVRYAMVAIAILVPGYVLVTSIQSGWQGYKARYSTTNLPPLYGLYEVDSFTGKDGGLPAMITDSIRWRWLMFERPGIASAVTLTDASVFYKEEVDEPNSKLILSTRLTPILKYTLKYSQPDATHLQLTGDVNGEPLSINLSKLDLNKKFLLTSRGFHWINENPLNR